MAPFAGTTEEMKLLSHYLGSLGDAPISEGPALGEGQRIFEAKCFFCHATEANWPMERLVQDRTSEEFYEKIARLPEINPIMPRFGGTGEIQCFPSLKKTWRDEECCAAEMRPEAALRKPDPIWGSYVLDGVE